MARGMAAAFEVGATPMGSLEQLKAKDEGAGVQEEEV